LVVKMLKNIIPTFLVKSAVHSKREEKKKMPNKTEAEDSPTKADSCGRTPLHRACWNGEDSRVRELMVDGDMRQLNAKDQWGRTPLWCAVTQGHLETVKILIENKDVKLDTKDSYGKDLHFRAKEKGFHDISEVLKKANENRQLEEYSEEVLKTKLDSAEHQLFELEKKNAGELDDLEIRCSEAVEKLILENEDKICKLKEKQQEESKILRRLVESINEKIMKNPRQADCSAPPAHHLLPCPECPVCMENMLPPRRIFQCKNGHIICEICQPKIKDQKCPTCQQDFVGRAVAMEQHLRDLFMN